MFFFRPAKKSEYSSVPENKQMFVLENKQGIQQKILVQDNQIYPLEGNKEMFLVMLNMIEEYLFMKYDTIMLIDYEDSDIEKFDWEKNKQQYIKKKPTMLQRKYTIKVQENSSD